MPFFFYGYLVKKNVLVRATSHGLNIPVIFSPLLTTVIATNSVSVWSLGVCRSSAWIYGENDKELYACSSEEIGDIE